MSLVVPLLALQASVAHAQAGATASIDTASGDRAAAARAPAPPFEAVAADTTLTLDEAIDLARRYNPDYRAQRNDSEEADWAVRAAWGALLPSARVSTGMQYQASGQARFGIFTGRDLGYNTTPPYYLSDYSLGLSYRLDAGVLSRLDEARAGRRAAEARADAGRRDLAYSVTQQYLAVLRAQDVEVLRRQELQRAERTLELARARVATGAAIRLDAKQAEVERGRAEVALLQAENQRQTELLRLMERIGLEREGEVTLTSEFGVFRPDWSEAELLEVARSGHPQLRALGARVAAGEAAVSTARRSYLPALEVSAGWSGYTREVGDPGYLIEQAEDRAEQQVQNCHATNLLSDRLTRPLPGTPLDCSSFRLTPAEETQIMEGNDVFPFSFTRQPFTMRLQLSVPLFQGLDRQRQVATARARAEDARAARRAEELRLRTEIASLHRSLRTQHRAVELEADNRQVASEQLQLARERYRAGAVRFLELAEAETLMARAEQAYLDAVYRFHETLAALEAAAGRRLRPRESR